MFRPPECIYKSTRLSDLKSQLKSTTFLSPRFPPNYHVMSARYELQQSVVHARTHPVRYHTHNYDVPSRHPCRSPSRPAHYTRARPWFGKSTVMAACQSESHVLPYIIINGLCVHVRGEETLERDGLGGADPHEKRISLDAL